MPYLKMHSNAVSMFLSSLTTRWYFYGYFHLLFDEVACADSPRRYLRSREWEEEVGKTSPEDLHVQNETRKSFLRKSRRKQDEDEAVSTNGQRAAVSTSTSTTTTSAAHLTTSQVSSATPGSSRSNSHLVDEAVSKLQQPVAVPTWNISIADSYAATNEATSPTSYSTPRLHEQEESTAADKNHVVKNIEGQGKSVEDDSTTTAGRDPAGSRKMQGRMAEPTTQSQEDTSDLSDKDQALIALEAAISTGYQSICTNMRFETFWGKECRTSCNVISGIALPQWYQFENSCVQYAKEPDWVPLCEQFYSCIFGCDIYGGSRERLLYADEQRRYQLVSKSPIAFLLQSERCDAMKCRSFCARDVFRGCHEVMFRQDCESMLNRPGYLSGNQGACRVNCSNALGRTVGVVPFVVMITLSLRWLFF
ncbi:unnamed protein product [Amoebophrya sp. A25]|nr:unnamed protein product [Amoebophrya sp. A25]|eukprot:GSA25T00005621001.1